MTWDIKRENGADLDVDEVFEVDGAAGLGARRTIADTERRAALLRHASLVLTCRTNGELVCIARSISDSSYATHLSAIAVSRAHQRSGIGKALIEATQKEAAQAKIVLLSAPAAAEYYPHLGFTQHNSAWVLSA